MRKTVRITVEADVEEVHCDVCKSNLGHGEVWELSRNRESSSRAFRPVCNEAPENAGYFLAPFSERRQNVDVCKTCFECFEIWRSKVVRSE